MRKALLAASLPFLLFLQGCSREASTTPTATAPRVPPKMKVGLLTPGSINDGGWNAIAYEGLRKIESDLNAAVSHQQTTSPAEFSEGFRYFGVNGYNLAFGHGFEFQDAALEAGKLFPRTIFVTTSGSSVSSNVAPMVFELEQATYLLGMIAALESKSGKAGLVGGIKLPSIDSTFIAFKAGAKAVNPDFEIKEVYLGNFDDLGAAKVASLTLIQAGCDFLFHQANEAGRGVFQACQERKVRCFGSNRNQNDLAPDVIVASAVLDVPSAFVHLARLVSEGRFQPAPQRLGMNQGIVSLIWNEARKKELRPQTVSAVLDAERKIRSGSLVVPRGNF